MSEILGSSPETVIVEGEGSAGRRGRGSRDPDQAVVGGVGDAVEGGDGVVEDRGRVDRLAVGAGGDPVARGGPAGWCRSRPHPASAMQPAGVRAPVVGVAVEADDRVVVGRGGVDRLAVGADGDRSGAVEALLGGAAAGGVADVGNAARRGEGAGGGVAVEAGDRVVEFGGGVDRLAVGADGDRCGAVEALLGGAAAGRVCRRRRCSPPGSGHRWWCCGRSGRSRCRVARRRRPTCRRG